MNNIVFSVKLYQLTLIVFFFLGALWVNIFDREVLSLQMMEAVCLKFMAPCRNSLCTFSAWRCSLTLQQSKDGHCSDRGPACLRGISRGGMQGVPPPPRWHATSCDPSSSLFPLKICLHHMSFKSFLSGAPPPKKNPASTPVPRSSIIFPSFASYEETFKFTEWGHSLFLQGTLAANGQAIIDNN